MTQIILAAAGVGIVVRPVWGITAERVRQIERQAIAKLRDTTLAA